MAIGKTLSVPRVESPNTTSDFYSNLRSLKHPCSLRSNSYCIWTSFLIGLVTSWALHTSMKPVLLVMHLPSTCKMIHLQFYPDCTQLIQGFILLLFTELISIPLSLIAPHSSYAPCLTSQLCIWFETNQYLLCYDFSLNQIVGSSKCGTSCSPER